MRLYFYLFSMMIGAQFWIPNLGFSSTTNMEIEHEGSNCSCNWFAGNFPGLVLIKYLDQYDAQGRRDYIWGVGVFPLRELMAGGFETPDEAMRACRQKYEELVIKNECHGPLMMNGNVIEP